MHKKQRTQSRPWLKKRGLRWPLIGLGVLGMVVLVGLGIAAGTLGGKGNLRAVLRKGNLGALPSHAADVRYGGAGGSASGVYYLRFTAPPEEIDTFIANSPDLRVRTPQALGPEHMYLPEARRGPDAGENSKHRYYLPDGRFVWCEPEVCGKGRLYVIPPDVDSNSVEVVIDDEKQTVYVRVKHN